MDNPNPADPDRVVDDMVHITHHGLDFWIYRYEASRQDASDSEMGEDTSIAVSQPPVQQRDIGTVLYTGQIFSASTNSSYVPTM